jgi:hypothetical protein
MCAHAFFSVGIKLLQAHCVGEVWFWETALLFMEGKVARRPQRSLSLVCWKEASFLPFLGIDF